MLKLVIILLLLKPFAVFALEPTAGIVCNELNKKQNAEFLFKSDDEKIFSKVYKRINGKFKLVGNVVGERVGLDVGESVESVGDNVVIVGEEVE